MDLGTVRSVQFVQYSLNADRCVMTGLTPGEREFIERIGTFLESRLGIAPRARMRCSGAAARKADSDPPR
jgi:hypothetical protein